MNRKITQEILQHLETKKAQNPDDCDYTVKRLTQELNEQKQLGVTEQEVEAVIKDLDEHGYISGTESFGTEPPTRFSAT
ncbi:MAG: hypothetical protein Q4A82_00595 [Corynebacterium sp.]|nr:hypothetical protein [Corynebacterium sp.]